MKHIHTARTLSAILLCLAFALPAAHSATVPSPPGVADGKTQILTPEGTWITPPPGAPLAIAPEVETAAEGIVNGSSWGLHKGVSPMLFGGGCTDYKAGWYETNNGDLYGGHAGIVTSGLPVVTTNYCTGKGMGYTDGIDFGAGNWIQDGIVTFPGETGAKWMCQSNTNGALDTRYGTASQYGNGATVYTWFARDSSGIWRTYRYDTGPYSVELGCTISYGESGGAPLQAFGEIQGATSTSAPMGPWKMFDLRYEDTTGTWYVPSTVMPFSDACPPYGEGTISSGAFTAGSGQACTSSSHSYP